MTRNSGDEAGFANGSCRDENESLLTRFLNAPRTRVVVPDEQTTHFLDLLSELSRAEVRFLIIGAYAVGAHGRPRATKDLDVWIDATSENAHEIWLTSPLSNAFEVCKASTPTSGEWKGREGTS